MHVRVVLVGVVALLAACKQSDKAPSAKSTEQPAATGSATGSATTSAATPGAGATTGAACKDLELVRVSTILNDNTHPCRAVVDASYGRIVATGVAFSGTVVATTPPRGGGFLITCQHCTGPDGDGLHDPEVAEPSAFQVRAPSRPIADGKVHSGHEEQIFFAHRLFAHQPPKSAFDAKGHLVHILPEHDFVLATVSGKPVTVVGHLGALPSAQVSDDKLDVHDPKQLAGGRNEPWAAATPGKQALVLGYPRDLPDKEFDGELVASVGEILDDARAKDLLARSDPDEAAIAYDPEVELIIAARAVSGMSGGGAFDDAGRYLGVSVRGTVKPVDGKYLVRVVRAPYVMKQFALAHAAAPEPLRAKITPFLPTRTVE